MKDSQKDRIRVDPAQAPIELRSAPVNETEPEWMGEMEELLRSSDSIYLQYKSGVLRFRRANHDAGKHRTFITLGNQDEVDLFASENWQNIRYLYAMRRIGAFCFDVVTLFSHKSNNTEKTRRIELGARLDTVHPSGEPQFTFDATGSGASVDIIEWRGTVREGEVGRYTPEAAHMEISCRSVTRPFTFLHEDRVEFHNHSFTFSGEKMQNQLKRLVKKRLRQIEDELAEQSALDAEDSEATES
ncbi:MAG: hypothetical protein AB8B55_07245 [Mariniblastus sp.]